MALTLGTAPAAHPPDQVPVGTAALPREARQLSGCCSLPWWLLPSVSNGAGRRVTVVVDDWVVADDWRVTVAFRDEADAQRAVQSFREHELEGDVAQRLAHRVVMSVDGPTVFLYAGTEGTAREADRVVREVLAQQQLSAEFTLDRWHPLEEEWEDVSVPMPDTAEQRAAEHQHLVDYETEESLAAGQAGWEVRVELRSHRQAVELAERLQAEGRPVIRRWKYLVLGANNEDDASSLAEAIRRESTGEGVRAYRGGPVCPVHGEQPGNLTLTG